MKRFLTAFCLVLGLLLVAPSEALAQPKHGVALRYNFYNFLTPRPDSKNIGDIWTEAKDWGIEAAYYNRVFRRTYLVVPVKFGQATFPDSSENSVVNLDLMLQHHVFNHRAIFNPFIQYGFGGLWIADNENENRDDITFNVPLGAGFDVRITRNLLFTAQTQYRPAGDRLDSWHHGVGLRFHWGDDPFEKPKDTDKDGIPDVSDQCPEVPGVPSAMGCPDRDGDSVADDNDQCPDIAGVVRLQGCPDRDNDGIADKDDQCPDQPGTAVFNGCPDSDADGIADPQDKCPREAGPLATGGCPDRDADGITDRDDACPDEKGPLATKGCPDRDGDAVADRDDACPDKAGDPMHKGCPDTDGDGVYDNDDRCVTQSGPASNFGCPEMKKEDRAKIDLAVKAVQYETGKATLLPKSKQILDDVATVLLAYPYYNLNIGGHTDNVGSDALNQTLSENRARSVFDYLVGKGVPASRMTHAGYGETQPVADNKTAAGRAANRRTQFDLFIK